MVLLMLPAFLFAMYEKDGMHLEDVLMHMIRDVYKRQEYTNAPVKGQLKIYKQGEMLKGFDKDFQYEMTGLAGAEFDVYAAEDIYTADHQVDADGQRTLYFAKDALVSILTRPLHLSEPLWIESG